jgi:excisionase family DNA binding protein
MAELLTTAEAGERLGVTRHRVIALINAGRLPAQRVGMQFLIRPADLALVKDRKPGRPPKAGKPVKAKRKGTK